MKQLIAGIIIGVLLTAVTASASSIYWQRGGNTYTCQGIGTSVRCKETNWKPSYAVHILPRDIAVTFEGNVIFGCERGLTPTNNCAYYGP